MLTLMLVIVFKIFSFYITDVNGNNNINHDEQLKNNLSPEYITTAKNEAVAGIVKSMKKILSELESTGGDSMQKLLEESNTNNINTDNNNNKKELNYFHNLNNKSHQHSNNTDIFSNDLSKTTSLYSGNGIKIKNQKEKLKTNNLSSNNNKNPLDDNSLTDILESMKKILNELESTGGDYAQAILDGRSVNNNNDTNHIIYYSKNNEEITDFLNNKNNNNNISQIKSDNLNNKNLSKINLFKELSSLSGDYNNFIINSNNELAEKCKVNDINNNNDDDINNNNNNNNNNNRAQFSPEELLIQSPIKSLVVLPQDDNSVVINGIKFVSSSSLIPDNFSENELLIKNLFDIKTYTNNSDSNTINNDNNNIRELHNSNNKVSIKNQGDNINFNNKNNIILHDYSNLSKKDNNNNSKLSSALPMHQEEQYLNKNYNISEKGDNDNIHHNNDTDTNDIKFYKTMKNLLKFNKLPQLFYHKIPNIIESKPVDKNIQSPYDKKCTQQYNETSNIKNNNNKCEKDYDDEVEIISPYDKKAVTIQNILKDLKTVDEKSIYSQTYSDNKIQNTDSEPPLDDNNNNSENKLTYVQPECTREDNKITCKLGRFTYIINDADNINEEALGRFVALIYRRSLEGDKIFDISVVNPKTTACYVETTTYIPLTTKLALNNLAPITIVCTPIKQSGNPLLPGEISPSSQSTEIVYTCKWKKMGSI